jgi:hypothetical protein
MPIRTDLGDLVISEKNFADFIEGKEITENFPAEQTLPEACKDSLHCSCKNFNGYAQVTAVNQRNVILTKVNL